MVRPAPHASPDAEHILLIGDVQRHLLPTLKSVLPTAEVTCIGNFFEGLAELSAGHYTTVLAAAEPIERRPESAVKSLRELAGQGRVLLFGHPTLEPLSRKMLEFGVDDYLITPASPNELQQVFATPVNRLNAVASVQDAVMPVLSDPGPAPAVHPLAVADADLAELLLEVMLQTPHDAPSGVVAALNQKLSPVAALAFTPAGAAAPAGDADQITVSQTVSGVDGAELGSLHLTVNAGTGEALADAFSRRVARLLEKVNALQDRHNRLQKLAITDELTGLYNGRYFRHFLNRMVDKARHLRFPVTLLLFDIDNFKKYNDTYGHGVGDEILRQTASLMRRCVRDHDLVARISGDEFAVVFWEKEGPRQPRDPATAGAVGRPPQTPVQLLERFRRLLSNQNFSGLGPDGQGTLTISGGLAVYPWDAENSPDLIEAADRALMFKAKQSGKNSIYLVGGKCTTDAESAE